VGGQSGEELGSNWGDCEDKSIWLEDFRLREPCFYGLRMISEVTVSTEVNLTSVM
jgi:hypothetical protein